ncbi:hypothetical protein [Puniceibacterium confluentis]|uniref:hypothetical protein n=1 Tax=Puniceibacterium confluentis TaxID=1958944 RepID=UPI003562F420
MSDPFRPDAMTRPAVLGPGAAFGALAWLLSRVPFVVPIPGTIRISHMAEDVAPPTSASPITNFWRPTARATPYR